MILLSEILSSHRLDGNFVHQSDMLCVTRDMIGPFTQIIMLYRPRRV